MEVGAYHGYQEGPGQEIYGEKLWMIDDDDDDDDDDDE